MGHMTQDERMGELMGRALQEIDPPPPTPREEMWARIQARRAPESGTSRRDVIDLRSRMRRTTWIPWSAAVAATLAVGIGLGRITTETTPVPLDPTVASGTAEGAVPPAYRLAATNHLERTETLLASLAVDSRPGGAREMSSWARELLTDTRLLLASPAAEDAATRRLLEDLELVLAQIAGIPEARAEQEVELIHDGINQSDVLLRLRAATAGPRLVGT
jgi:hypothetical protein